VTAKTDRISEDLRKPPEKEIFSTIPTCWVRGRFSCASQIGRMPQFEEGKP